MVEFEVFCATCGGLLDADFLRHRQYAALSVSPCSSCQDETIKEAEEKGYEIGWEESRDEILSETMEAIGFNL